MPPLRVGPTPAAGGATPGAGLPRGSAARNMLRWDAAAGAWEAVTAETTTYHALTRAATYEAVAEAVGYALEEGLSAYPPLNDLETEFEPWSVRVGYDPNTFTDTGQSQQISNVWPDGGPAPYAWVLAPSWTGWVDDFDFVYEDNSTPGTDRTLRPADWDVVETRKLTINAVPYDWARVQVPGGRPRPTRDTGGLIRMLYDPPPTPVAIAPIV